jgi:hypothetical protein
MVQPMLSKMLGSIPDDQIKAIAEQYADAFLEQAKEKGGVNLFGIELGPKAFEGLKDILATKFSKK